MADPHSEVRRPALLPAVQTLLALLVVALFITTFTVQPIRIPSSSMEPTLLVGDFLLMNKQDVAGRGGWLLPPTRIHHGDVVVFHDPVEGSSLPLVKRVVGLPGDRLHLHRGQLYLNGQPLPEPYAVHQGAAEDLFRDEFPSLLSMDAAVNPAWWIRLRTLTQDGDLPVPTDSLFVLGDNRDNSEDSRYWGFVKRNAVMGKPLLIYFSWRTPEARAPEERPPEERTPEDRTPELRVPEPQESLTPLPQPGSLSGHGRGSRPMLVSTAGAVRWSRLFEVVH